MSVCTPAHPVAKFEVVLSKLAKRTMSRLPESVRNKIDAKISAVAANNNVKPLRGVPGFRLRIGDWRVLYEIDHPGRRVRVRSVRNRGDAYKK